MGISWSGATQWKNAKNLLRHVSGNPFADKALPFLLLLDNRFRLTEAGRSHDVSGMDAIAENESGSIEWAVQCKGFEVVDDRLGDDQVQQCYHSIDTLRTSRFRPKRYTLVHNRDHRVRSFEQRVKEKLASLVDDGIVESAELWMCDELLKNAFDALAERVIRLIRQQAKAGIGSIGDRMAREIVEVEQVPFHRGTLRISDGEFEGEISSNLEVGDPLTAAQFQHLGRLTLILGTFGVGKSKQSMRLASRSPHPVLVTPGAMLPVRRGGGAKDLHSLLIPRQALIEQLDDRFVESIYEGMLKLVASKLLESEDAEMVLVIDGLDESQLISSPVGFKYFVDSLATVRAPIVLTMRTEFWAKRREEFRAAFVSSLNDNAVSLSPGYRKREGSILELNLWQDEQMTGFVMEHGVNEPPERKTRIAELTTLIREGKFEKLYGDIPRRPLFLRMLTDRVAKIGLSATSRARLFYDWIFDKLRRDRTGPTKWNQANTRVGILEDIESVDSTLRLAWDAMVSAAGVMHEVTNGKLVLRPVISLDELALAIPWFNAHKHQLRLELNSLLTFDSMGFGMADQVRFAHFSFQEFMFSWRTVFSNSLVLEAELPDEIVLWQAAIRQEFCAPNSQ